MEAIKKTINISDSEIISNRERYVERSRAKGMSIRGKALLKIRNASYTIVVRGVTY